MICVRTGAEMAPHFSSTGWVMAKLRRAQHTARPADVVSVATLARRISALGTASAAVTGLVLCAIVQDSLTAPDPRRAAAGHAQPTATPSGGHRHHAGGGHKPVATSPKGTLDRVVRKVVNSRARRLSGASVSGSAIVHTDRRDPSRTWAFGTSLLATHAGAGQMTEADLFLAQRRGKHWRIGLAGSAKFRRLLRDAPASVLTASERATLAAYSGGFSPTHAATGGTVTGLHLPWTAAATWTLAGTAGTPPGRTVTFTPGKGSASGRSGVVRAAGTGRLYRLCGPGARSGPLLLVHRNGLATEYEGVVHQTRVPSGGMVPRGAYLGHVGRAAACDGPAQPGGDATPARLRFTLRDVSGPLPCEGMRLGPWTLHARGTKVWATHGHTRVAAGHRLAVASPGVSSATPTSPTPHPSASGGRPRTPSPSQGEPAVLR